MAELVSDSLKALRYQQVYSLLRGWIFDGTYPAGAKLPPEGELCEQLGVSRITSRKALDLLVAQGLVERIQGKGTYVAQDLPGMPSVGDMSHLIRKVTRLTNRSKVVHIRIREVEADAETCRDLHLKPNAMVREITFVRTVEGSPTGYRHSFMPLDVAPDITADEIRTTPMLTVLENHGLEISAADQLIGASLADSHKAMLLETTVGEPLVRIRMVLYDKDKRPIERSTRYYLADRYEHRIYLTRKDGIHDSNRNF